MRTHRRAILLLAALALSGCGTICYPERSLLPQSQRGDTDVGIFILDIIVSAPTILIGIFAMAGGGGGGPDAWKILFLPLWIDSKQGTLWHPQE